MPAAENRTMEKPKERQNHMRRRVLKRAQIVFKGHEALIDCVVLNLSGRGACLKVETPIGIPDKFDLMLDQASVRNCRVVWRKATQIGIQFVLSEFSGSGSIELCSIRESNAEADFPTNVKCR